MGQGHFCFPFYLKTIINSINTVFSSMKWLVDLWPFKFSPFKKLVWIIAAKCIEHYAWTILFSFHRTFQPVDLGLNGPLQRRKGKRDQGVVELSMGKDWKLWNWHEGKIPFGVCFLGHSLFELFPSKTSLWLTHYLVLSQRCPCPQHYARTRWSPEGRRPWRQW